jgi:dTDP-4-amino-4,6-dideoxygalactose transaminase
LTTPVKFLDLKTINKRHEQSFHEALQRVLDSGLFILGNEVEKFEKQYAQYCGTKYCIGVANGLDALFLSFKAYLEIGLLEIGDEVIVPANTYIASILAISANGLKPVLVEPDIETYLIDSDGINKAITDKTKAVLVVHLYGQCADMEAIHEIASAHKLLIIEDCAQSHGAVHKNKLSGNLGHIAAHSFYPGKNLGALGDAGAVTTNDIRLSEMIYALRNYGSIIKYENAYKGVNSRMDELQASLLLAKMDFLNSDNEVRCSIANYYLNHITNPLVILPNVAQGNKHVWHLFVVRVSQRDAFQEYLEKKQIQTVIHYPIPPHQQAAYKELNDKSFPVTEQIHREVISLPISPVMPKEQVVYVVDVINQWKG